MKVNNTEIERYGLYDRRYRKWIEIMNNKGTSDNNRLYKLGYSSSIDFGIIIKFNYKITIIL
ncbi:hypothetical protein A0H76_1738 [Hepatospora eriocheir]|uniref:Uncharacterized protein n=1 Tax=Hepatospora eriocheir TaxID=1081669 RepID=A0A1X0Q5Q7_9MICR|nr:hypothetical protein A0H76_1738 [Hepatospora eriocheir]